MNRAPYKDRERMPNGLRWCSFCEMGHSAASCFHPARMRGIKVTVFENPGAPEYIIPEDTSTLIATGDYVLIKL